MSSNTRNCCLPRVCLWFVLALVVETSSFRVNGCIPRCNTGTCYRECINCDLVVG